MDTKPPCSTDPDRWFSEDDEDVAFAKAGCNRCPMKARQECLKIGIQEDDKARVAGLPITPSVWGGLTAKERQRLSRFDRTQRATKMKWTPDKSVFLCTAVMAGRPYAHIAADLGVSEMSVRMRVGKERAQGHL